MCSSDLYTFLRMVCAWHVRQKRTKGLSNSRSRQYCMLLNKHATRILGGSDRDRSFAIMWSAKWRWSCVCGYLVYVCFQCQSGTAVASCGVVSVHGLLEASVGKPSFCLQSFSLCTGSERLLQLCGARWRARFKLEDYRATLLGRRCL